MTDFESLLRADAAQLVQIFYRFPIETDPSATFKRKRLGANLGLNPAQLVCGLGFNHQAATLTDVIATLGFSTYADLAEQRDFLFINDPYRFLPVSNIVDVYRFANPSLAGGEDLADLVSRRLRHMEMELDRTLNPNAIQAYKAEVRALYEYAIGMPQLAEQRLEADYAGLRGITDEALIMMEFGTLAIDDLFCRPGLSPDEKRRLLNRAYVPESLLRRRLAAPDLSPQERAVLLEWREDNAA
jgi:hypothetical protein